AELVKVVTRPEHASHGSQSLVYRDDGQWKTTILANSSNGFQPDNHEESDHGTEVTAYIPGDKTTPDQIRNHLYRHLGMVPPQRGQIIYRDEVINTLRDTYQTAEPTAVQIGKKQDTLIMGFSKREMDGNFSDTRFLLRNQQLDKILHTQRGLFIKYESAEFDEETIHHKLIADLMSMGLDFWVEAPASVTLTKGRNNYTADYQPTVLEATYHAFETLYLETILNDDEIIYHPSGALLNGLADLFKNKYNLLIESREGGKYSWKVQTMASLAALGSVIADISTKIGSGASYIITDATPQIMRGTGRGLAKGAIGIGKGIQYMYQRIPDVIEHSPEYVRNIPSAMAHACQALAHKGSAAMHSDRVRYSILATAAVGGTAAASLYLYHRFGSIPFKYAGGGLAGLAAVTALGTGAHQIYTHREQIAQKTRIGLEAIVHAAIHSPDAIRAGLASARDAIMNLPDTVRGYASILTSKIGLFSNLEEKRERKRKRKRDKITKKYMSTLQKDQFLMRILDKRIIYADRYLSQTAIQTPEGRAEMMQPGYHKSIFDKMMDFVAYGAEGPRIPKWRNAGPVYHKDEMILQRVKISIDEMIELYLNDKLKYDNQNTWDRSERLFSHGDTFVDYNNPVVKGVIDNMDSIKWKVRESYDVKLIEDHLLNIGQWAAGMGLFLYTITPVGIAHMFYTVMHDSGATKNPFAGHKIYDHLRASLRSSAQRTKTTLAETDWNAKAQTLRAESYKLAKQSAHAAGVIGAFPFKLGYRVSGAIYQGCIDPAIHAMDPRKYPDYIQRAASGTAHHIARKHKENRLKREQHANARELRKQDDTTGPMHRLRARLAQSMRGIGDEIKDNYHNSPINYLFGKGWKTGSRFDTMPISELESLVSGVDAALSYPALLHAFQNVENIIGRATESDPLEVYAAYNHKDNSFENLGVAADKRGRIQVDIQSGSIERFASFAKRRAEQGEYSTLIDYCILETLLHMHAHLDHPETLGGPEGKGKPTKHPYQCTDRNHHATFYSDLDELRRQVIDYMIENGINLDEANRAYFPQDPSAVQPFFHLEAKHVHNFSRMTRKRLKEQKEYTAMRKAEIEDVWKKGKPSDQEYKSSEEYEPPPQPAQYHWNPNR
ncbi:MAG: hypothetical protein ABIH41_02045, partial [Nanoarchaeota archaeon]